MSLLQCPTLGSQETYQRTKLEYFRCCLVDSPSIDVSTVAVGIEQNDQSQDLSWVPQLQVSTSRWSRWFCSGSTDKVFSKHDSFFRDSWMPMLSKFLACFFRHVSPFTHDTCCRPFHHAIYKSLSGAMLGLHLTCWNTNLNVFYYSSKSLSHSINFIAIYWISDQFRSYLMSRCSRSCFPVFISKPGTPRTLLTPRSGLDI